MNPTEEIRSLEQFVPDQQRAPPNLSYHGKEQPGGEEEQKDAAVHYREQGFLPYREIRDAQPDPARDQGWWGPRPGQVKGEIPDRVGYPYPRPDLENRFPTGYTKDQDEILVRKPWRGEGGEETLVRRDELKSEYGEGPGPAGTGEYPVGYAHPYYPHNYHPYYNQG